MGLLMTSEWADAIVGSQIGPQAWKPAHYLQATTCSKKLVQPFTELGKEPSENRDKPFRTAADSATAHDYGLKLESLVGRIKRKLARDPEVFGSHTASV